MSRTVRIERINRPARAVLCAVALAVLAAPAGLLAQQSRTRGDADNGKRLFYAHGCYGCHGYNGDTGVRDLVGTGSPIVQNEDVFLQFLRLRADQAPAFPSTRMPNYPKEALSDSDARDIFAYVRTFRLDAPDVDDVPVFRKILESASRPYEP
jgi:mono/diheme cytochrome c family protein